MDDNNPIWLGPGVLCRGANSKAKKSISPGESIPKGFIDSKRLAQLQNLKKVVSTTEYTKSQAAEGKVPVQDATSEIKGLESQIKSFGEENEKLKTEIETLSTESEKLKTENETLSADSKGLLTENDKLKADNVALEADNKRLVKDGK